MNIQTTKTAVSRRNFLTAMGAAGLFFTEKGLFAQTLTLTPSTTEGPYYPDTLPLDRDNDLLVVNNNITPAVGTVAWLSGRILDRNGSPVRNAVMEIWQADNYGSYIHSRGVQNGQRDGNFQGYGTFETASDGRYLFRTIKPGLYTGRVRHVHAKITLPGGRSLTTQLHIEGETSANDNVLSSIRDAAQLASVIRPWTVIPGSPIGALAANWDVVMDFTPSDNTAQSKPTIYSTGGVTSGASFRRGASSSSWITISGNGLAATTRTWNAADFTAPDKLPESLDGVSVRINNQPAAVYYVSPTQLNVLAPESTVEGNVQVTVTNASGASDPVTVPLTRLMPAFFQAADEYISAVHADGALVGPDNPARPGETIQLYGTGFQSASSPTVRIDAADAEVAWAGLSSPGVYQINVKVPAGLAKGDYPVTASIDGVRTLKFVKLPVAG